MFVSDVMQGKVYTVTPSTPLPEAFRLLAQRGIRHLPVMDDGRLVGMVSDRDLKQAMASSVTTLAPHELTALLARVPVSQIMSRAVLTIDPTGPVEEAARLMVQERIGALPVTDGERLVGIVTETDVLRLFVRAMGAGEPSSRVDVELEDRPGALVEALSLAEKAGAPVSSVMTLPGPPGRRKAAIRLRTIYPAAAVRAIAAAGHRVAEAWRG